jgi:hypothetical protein
MWLLNDAISSEDDEKHTRWGTAHHVWRLGQVRWRLWKCMKNLTQEFSSHCKLLKVLLQDGVFNERTAADQTKFELIIFTSLLSLGGLPPLLGFLPKWIVIQAIITNNMAPLATIVVVTSLITIYYYLKISYSRFIILNTEPKWNLKSHKNKPTKNIRALILSSISLIGIAVRTIITNTN